MLCYLAHTYEENHVRRRNQSSGLRRITMQLRQGFCDREMRFNGHFCVTTIDRERTSEFGQTAISLDVRITAALLPEADIRLRRTI
jgi:hypothetical protein